MLCRKILWRAKRHVVNVLCGLVMGIGILTFAVGICYLVTRPLSEASAVAFIAAVAGIVVAVAGYGSTRWRFDHTLSSDELEGDYDN